MRKESAIVTFTFGWGQQFKLYQYHLDVNGKSYALKDLTRIRPMYQRVLGVPSLRLELQFGRRKIILRGIAAVEDGQKAIDFLTRSYAPVAGVIPHSETGSDWSRSGSGTLQSETNVEEPEILQGQDPLFEPESALLDLAHAVTAKVEAAAPNWQRFRQEQREHRQRRLHIERSLRQQDVAAEQRTRQAKDAPLPIIEAPLCLLPGEHAHYSVEATHCGEPIGDATHYTYPAKDHGTLILTSKRIIYLGRRSQIVLSYERLLHVSRLQGAIAFQAEHWYTRELFEMRRPVECATYLERILQQFQQERLAYQSPSLYTEQSETPIEQSSRQLNFDGRFDDRAGRAGEDVDAETMQTYASQPVVAEAMDSYADW